MKRLISSINFIILLLFLTACTTQTRITPTRQAASPTASETTITDLIAKYGCIPLSNGIETAQLIEVIDGDTIDVSINGVTYRVRYIGINSPEYDAENGYEATHFNSSIVEGQEFYLVKDISETDVYGRLLRYVFTSNTFINYEILLNGYALQVDYEPDTACSEMFAEAEKQAAEAGQGIWAAPDGGIDSPAVQISSVNYHGKNGSTEPDEYVEINNTGDTPVNITGWYLKDQSKHRFIFPEKILAAGEICRVYTAENHPETCGFSFDNPDSGVWNNDGDCAILYDAQDLMIDEYCFP